MKRLIPYINHEVKVLEAQLQTEESGTKVAIIQGKLAGYHSMISILNEIENTNFKNITDTKEIPCKYNTEFQKWVCDCQEFDVVLNLSVTFNSIDVEETIKSFNYRGEERIQKKKDWLFYTAEKGRDLHFVKGWYFMFNILNEWKEAIQSQYEYLSKKNRENLPFDIEMEDD